METTKPRSSLRSYRVSVTTGYCTHLEVAYSKMRNSLPLLLLELVIIETHKQVMSHSSTMGRVNCTKVKTKVIVTIYDYCAA